MTVWEKRPWYDWALLAGALVLLGSIVCMVPVLMITTLVWVSVLAYVWFRPRGGEGGN